MNKTEHYVLQVDYGYGWVDVQEFPFDEDGVRQCKNVFDDYRQVRTDLAFRAITRYTIETELIFSENARKDMDN